MPVVLLLVLAVLGPARPAFAHTSLKKAVPAAGSAVPSPAAVVLTYADPVIFPNVVVTDGSGRQVQDGKASVDGKAVTAKIAGILPGGAYQVAWRAVSPDGHPISGTYSFTVTGGTAAVTAPAASTPATQPSAGSGGWWVLGLIALLLAAPVAAVAAFRRSRRP